MIDVMYGIFLGNILSNENLMNCVITCFIMDPASRIIVVILGLLANVVLAHKWIEPREHLLGLVDSTLYKSCVSPPPICPNHNITFYLYTSATEKNPHQLDVSKPDTLKSAKFLVKRPIKLIIHGYTGHKDYSPNTEIRPAYLKSGNLNVISIDYNPLVREPCYITAAYNVPLVGNCTAQLIDLLVNYRLIDLKDVHVIGFSLGAQVAGHINNFIQAGKLERVTGLDPAMPLFMGPFSQNKLDSSDAKFVDVIHTNAGRKGKIEPSGHVDFYLNGGTHQPGCSDPEVDNPNGCSHVRAPIYYAESIASVCGFWGSQCTNYLAYVLGWCHTWGPTSQLMGDKTNTSGRGIFFLNTNSQSPFARGRPNSNCNSAI